MEEYNSNSYRKILDEMKAILDDCCWNGKIIGKHYKKHPEDIKYQSLLNRSIKLIESTLGINNSQYKELIDFTNHDASSTRGWFLADIYETLRQAFQIFEDVMNADDKNTTVLLDDEKLEYDAFLSYATEDLEIAEKIYKHLINNGKSIWFYKKNVKPGDTVSLKVDYGIRKSKFGILLLSKNYLNKNWPRKEYSAFLKRAYDSGEDLVIPLYYGVNNVFVSGKSSFLSDIDAIVIKGNFKDVIKRIIDRLECKKKLKETDKICPTIEKQKTHIELHKPLPKLWYKKPWHIGTFASVFILAVISIVLLLVFKTNFLDRDLSTEVTETITSETDIGETTDTATGLELNSAENTTESTISNKITNGSQDSKETDEIVTQNEAPTIKLQIIEGPTPAEGGSICYYRVKAIVAGSPIPTIKFSKDDSNGSWGSDVTQVNLNYGESYTLTASASNYGGSASANIELKWAVNINQNDILDSNIDGVIFKVLELCYGKVPGGNAEDLICSKPSNFIVSYKKIPLESYGSKIVWIHYSDSGIPIGSVEKFYWYKDGNLFDSWETPPRTTVFEDSPSITFYINGKGLYQFEVYMDNNIALRVSFIIVD